MDFFARQEVARRRTWWLVVMFFAAIASSIGAVYAAIAFFMQAMVADDPALAGMANPMWNPEILLSVSGIISLIVLGGTGFKLAQLRHGGSRVAEMLGGKLISPGSNQFHEKRLLNVVEEMALASGVPVPPVYVMPGQMGINAFAAGYSIHDAVVGITEGAMRGLKREELQGVIGHEFSHILNGDMRLNIRLIGIVHGLLVLAIVGRVLMRAAMSGRRSSSKKDNGTAILLSVGLALVVIGYVGYFFGALIKRAVSRQREYLADASAVQFTRDPLGLASALRKVGGLDQGGRVQHAHAEELSHMFFADGIKRFFGGGSLFATHPPLAKRIKLLDPGFNGEFPPLTEDSLYLSGQESVERTPGKARAAKKESSARADVAGAVAQLPHALLAQAGELAPAHLEAAQAMMVDLPPELRDTVHDALGAQSMILALLLSSSGAEPSADAWAWLPASLSGTVGRDLDRLAHISPRQRHVLVDLAMPAVRSMSVEQATRFLELMDRIIHADKQVNLFEFSLQQIIRSGLREVMKISVPRIVFSKMADIATEAGILMNLMARAGQGPEGEAKAAFTAGMHAMTLPVGEDQFKMLTTDDLDQVSRALDKVRQASMPVRKQLLDAAIVCLMSDKQAVAGELDLFRAFAAVLEIPVPPEL